MKGNRNTV